MTQVPMDDARLKALFKTALVEVLEERKDLLRDAIEETLEDIALARAIESTGVYETEFGITCTFHGQRRLSPDEVALVAGLVRKARD